MPRFPLVCCFCILIFASTVSADDTKQPLAAFTLRVDFGKDRGQSFGSLFEARDANGRGVCGAGFADVYNTRFRTDRHTLQFFVRPVTKSTEIRYTRIVHPDLDTGVYLFDRDQKLYAWSSIRGNSTRRWNAKNRKWRDAHETATGRIRSGDGVMKVGNGVLTFGNNRAVYNGRQILAPPKAGRYYCFYYAHGRLFFYHTVRPKTGDGFTKVYACPWTPESKSPIDLSKAAVLRTKYVGATPFSYGQLNGKVLTVCNYGGVYAFDGKRWNVLLEASDKVSYQVYSMINHRDRLLFAQYPSGQLIEYRGGKKLTMLKGWPPRLPGTSPSAREAQTLSIYRGDLFVGVWPWAEIWRYDADAKKWHSHGRGFTHPKIAARPIHPYEPEAKQLGLVANHWGQRITGMIPIGDSLYLSTSSKGTSVWKTSYKFLTETQRREYGAVLKLTLPGNLAATMRWKNGPTELRFVVFPDRLEIRQDGKRIGSTRFKPTNAARFKNLKTTWSRGVFGRFSGKLLKHDSVVR